MMFVTTVSFTRLWHF